MGIGEPVKPGSERRSEEISDIDEKDRYPSKFGYGLLNKLFAILFMIPLVMVFGMTFPIVIIAFIEDPLMGIVSLTFPFGLIIMFAIIFTIPYFIVRMMYQSLEKDNHVLLTTREMQIFHKPGTRLQAINIKIPYKMIESVIIDPGEVEKEASSRSKKVPLQFLLSVPFPPPGGLYNGFARKENLMMLKLKKKIRIDKIVPGSGSTDVPQPHYVDHVFINVEMDRKHELKIKLEERRRMWSDG